jgi:P-type Mg2+ transporter
VDEDMIAKPRRWDIGELRNFMIVFGLISSVFDFLTFGVLLYVFQASPEMFRTGWFIESLLTELAIILVVRTYRPLHRSRPGALLLYSTLAVAGLTLVLPYLPIAEPLGFVPLPWPLLAAMITITVFYTCASELAKRVLHRRKSLAPPVGSVRA